MKILLNISRFIVGILFIFSGVIKANDPLGLSYKMQEFFEVWHWTGLDNFTLTLSIVMIIFEIVAGVAILLGWRMRLFSWLLLLLIIFFTFLTAYAVFSGKIRTCGCFGDCIPLTAMQSFLKDLFLVILIVIIFIFRNRIRPIFSGQLSLIILLMTFILSGLVQDYVLQHLPVVDCLGYKKNKNILAQMQVPPGAIPDSTVISFVYEKQGKTVEFTADKFPEDFNDDIYKFVRRYDKLVRKGNAEPAIRDFSLQTAAGNDTTQALLSEKGYKLLLFSREFKDSNVTWINEFRQILTHAAQKKIGTFVIASDYTRAEAWLASQQVDTHFVPVLKCDYVAIKTAARATQTLFLLKDGVITDKWGGVDFGKAGEVIRSLK